MANWWFYTPNKESKRFVSSTPKLFDHYWTIFLEPFLHEIDMCTAAVGWLRVCLHLWHRALSCWQPAVPRVVMVGLPPWRYLGLLLFNICVQIVVWNVFCGSSIAEYMWCIYGLVPEADTVRCHYNAVNFIKNIHRLHPVWSGFCRFSLCLIFLQWYRQYIVSLDRVITVLDCITSRMN